MSQETATRQKDDLDHLMSAALHAVIEAEQLAYAGGMRKPVGLHLVQAHSALMRAIDGRRST